MGAPRSTPQAQEIYVIVTNRKLMRTRMDKLGLSQRELAVMAGWRSHTLLSRILTGQCKTIDERRAVRLAFLLGVGLDDLFDTRSSSATQQTVAKKTTNRPVRTKVAA